jgi:hypothetical protein
MGHEPVIGVVTNPLSGKNRRNPGRLRELERAVGKHGVVRQTRNLDELAVVLREFGEIGCAYWVCDGGDGTLHWMLSTASRIAKDGCDPWPAIVPANGGSIDFVAHKAGIRGQAVDVIRELVACIERGETPETLELDTMRITAEGCDGPVERIGFAAALGGVAQRFFGKLYERDHVDAWGIVDVLAKSAAGGLAGTAWGPLRRVLVPSLQRYADEVFEPTHAVVELDGHELSYDRFASLQVGSIDISLGGVVRTFRHARERGILHAQAISMSRAGVVANIPNIVLGTPIWGSKVFDGPTSVLRAEAKGREPLEPVIDGEVIAGLRRLEVTRGPAVRVPAICTH